MVEVGNVTGKIALRDTASTGILQNMPRRLRGQTCASGECQCCEKNALHEANLLLL